MTGLCYALGSICLPKVGVSETGISLASQQRRSTECRLQPGYALLTQLSETALASDMSALCEPGI